LAVFVLLSGCSGLVGGGDNGTGTEGLPEDASAFDYADGFSADGIEDREAAVETYNDAVQAHGNYTGTYGYGAESGEGETNVDVEYRVDFETERAYQHAVVESPRVNATLETYYAKDKRYSLAEYEGQQGDVGVENRTFPPERLTASEAIEPLLLNASSYNASVERRNGEPVVVYRTTDIGSANGVLGVENSDSVVDFEATFAVDDEGLIHSASYRLDFEVDGNERTATMEFELTDIGSTTVEEPDWVGEANGS
jgi:hypothetical protein